MYFSAVGGNVGFQWSHDIIGAGDDFELQTRYVQFGAWSAILRLHDKGELEQKILFILQCTAKCVLI